YVPRMGELMKRIFLLAALALGGCVLVGQEQAERGKTALNGKTKAEILACAGIPSGSYRSGNVEYLGYAGSGIFRGGSSTYAGGGVFLHSPRGRSECVVTLALTNGRVT